MSFEVTLTKVIPTNVKRAFEAWLDPAALARFMRPGAKMPAARVEVDPRVGGAFSIIMLHGDVEMPQTGVYKIIDRYDELAFTWLNDFAHEGSYVSLKFRALSEERTELLLHHVGLTSENSRNSHAFGWDKILELSGELAD